MKVIGSDSIDVLGAYTQRAEVGMKHTQWRHWLCWSGDDG